MSCATEQVLAEHWQALAKGDIPAIMDGYADDAVFVMLDRTYLGKAEVQGYWVNSLSAMAGGQLTPGGQAVHGDVALCTWSFSSDAATIPAGVDSFVIRDGKIREQTCWYTVVPKGAA